MNLCLLADSYKLTHWQQYPPETQGVYSYFEARGGAYPATVFFGLQYVLKKYLCNPMSEEDVAEAESLSHQHFGRRGLFNAAGWRHVLERHDGYLPVLIRALPEGSLVPCGTPLITVENTCPRCFWTTNYIETLLVQTWYPITVATRSHALKQLIGTYLEQTGDPDLVPFKLHDFGFRGASSVESAGLGGCAHLLSFRGTDTLAALAVARNYYNEPCAGFSIPATEHSTITSWGRERELEALANVLSKYPQGFVACVSDSYDLWNACDYMWGDVLKERVLSRDGVLVIRPDSGNPAETVLRVVEILAERFGCSVNQKGYRVLDPHVRVIQGDGIDSVTIDEILRRLKDNRWSADNIAFGMGGALLQQLHRDTCKMAFKCSAVKIAGKWQPVYKDPVTDHNKKSKPGRMSVLPGFRTVPYTENNADLLSPVFCDGRLLRQWSLNEIRSCLEHEESFMQRQHV
jgi:nicotinamide phosphoribosyltransferase